LPHLVFIILLLLLLILACYFKEIIIVSQGLFGSDCVTAIHRIWSQGGAASSFLVFTDLLLEMAYAYCIH